MSKGLDGREDSDVVRDQTECRGGLEGESEGLGVDKVRGWQGLSHGGLWRPSGRT